MPGAFCVKIASLIERLGKLAELTQADTSSATLGKTPSLSVRVGADGRLLVRCFAGCDGRVVLAALRRIGLLHGSGPARPRGRGTEAHPGARGANDAHAAGSRLLGVDRAGGPHPGRALPSHPGVHRANSGHAPLPPAMPAP